MSAAYASNQPSGYHNYVRNIAIVGAAGQSGKYIADSLVKANRFNITAITRADSTSKIEHPGITIKKVSYDDQSDLVSALKGQDVLVITMATTAPKSASESLIRAAVEAKVPWILPNEWGLDLADEALAKDTVFGLPILENRKFIESVSGEAGGATSYISVVTGFWYEYSLSWSNVTYGFDFKNRKATFYDDGQRKINTSSWPQVGKGAAALLSLPILPQDSSDKSPTLSDYRNKTCYISSFTLSQEDMLASVLRVTGDKKEDWTISHEDVQQRWKKAFDDFGYGKGPGGMAAFGTLLYARPFFPDDSGNFEKRRGLDNEKIGLPSEDPDEYTKLAIQWAKEKGQMGVA